MSYLRANYILTIIIVLRIIYFHCCAIMYMFTHTGIIRYYHCDDRGSTEFY
jgi:phage gp36-like protein